MSSFLLGKYRASFIMSVQCIWPHGAQHWFSVAILKSLIMSEKRPHICIFFWIHMFYSVDAKNKTHKPQLSLQRESEVVYFRGKLEWSEPREHGYPVEVVSWKGACHTNLKTAFDLWNVHKDARKKLTIKSSSDFYMRTCAHAHTHQWWSL